jgi:hypothetical protein
MDEFFGPDQSAAISKTIADKLPSKISEEEEHAIRLRIEALDRLFETRVVAKYKIELQFGKGRSTWKPFPGAMSLYESGAKLHGGGDDKLYMCPGETCDGVVFPRERMGALVVCRKCKMMWNENDLIGELFFRLTPKNWASVIMKWLVRLELNADIYVKFHREDIRVATNKEMEKDHGGELLASSRGSRALSIYPMKNIIKDTKHGASLYDRIVQFITI